MTEEQAKTKWCPQVRNKIGIELTKTTAGQSVPHFVAITATNDKAKCIASDCMMWRIRRVRGLGQVIR